MFQRWKQEMDNGNIAMTMHDFATAEKHFESAIKESEKFGHNNLSLAQSLERKGDAILGQSPLENERAEECFLLFEKASGIYEATAGPVGAKVADCLTTMAKLILPYDKRESEKFSRRAATIYEELNSNKIIEPLEIIICIRHMDDDAEGKNKLLQELIDRFESNPDQSYLAKGLLIRARFHDDDKEAIKDYERALPLLHDSTENIPLVVDASVKLGRLLFQKEEFLSAENAFDNAISKGQCAPEVDTSTLEEAFCRKARLKAYYYRDFTEAERLLEQAESIKKSNPTGMRPIGSGVDLERIYLAAASGNTDMRRKQQQRDLEQVNNAFHDAPELETLHLMGVARTEMSLAETLIEEGNTDEAFQLWESALQKAPFEWMKDEAMVKMAYAYAKCGDVEKATQLADATHKSITAGSLPNILSFAMIAEYLIGRPDSADRFAGMLREQIDTDKQEKDDTYGIAIVACLSLAYALFCQGKTQAALDAVNEAITCGDCQSLFTAVTYENWSYKFKAANAQELVDILLQKAESIRDIVRERESRKSPIAPTIQ